MASTSSRQKVLAPERLNRLRAILRENQVARVDALCDDLGVSPATIRRDLEELERLGEVRRVHGGAVLDHRPVQEPMFDDKAAIAHKEKYRIALKALELIEPRDTIYLDGGSTVLELARLLPERTDITVVTNSLRAAMELAGAGPRLILIGGELRRLSQTMVGSLTRYMLEALHIDRAFMGTLGLSLEDGLTTTDPGEAYTKELVMTRARQVVLLADSGKVGKVSFSHAGALERVDVLISDRGIEAEFVKGVEERGIILHRV